EVRARGVGAADRVHDRQAAVPIEREQGLEGGVETEEAVEVERRVLGAAARSGYRDRGAQRAVRALAVGDDGVEPVASATLEDRHERLATPERLTGRGGPDESLGGEAERHQSQPRRLEKDAARGHCYFLWNSGEPSTSPATRVAEAEDPSPSI